jgi:acetyl-CoA acetyltransferase
MEVKMHREGVCFIGYGETPYVRPKEKSQSAIEYLADAIKLALDNSGLKKQDINGLAIGYTYPPQDVSSIAEWLGLELDWILRLDCGGAAGIVGARRAADAIQLGEIDVALCVGLGARPIGSGPIGGFESYQKENFASPYGFGGTNSHAALILRRYMADYGIKPEQMGKLAIAHRKNAEFNENALYRSPLTMEEYLNSRIICAPLRLYDCVAPCNGAAAFVMASERKAKELTKHPIYLVNDAEKVNYQVSAMPEDKMGSGFRALPAKLFTEVKREELDFVQMYDAYTIVVSVQLNDLGFCKPGKLGEFIDSHDFTFSGDFPLNTGGGQLSCGQASTAGAFLPVVEAIRQLKGEAQGHQVKGAKTGLVSAEGEPSVDCPFIYTAAMVLQRR